MKISYPIRDKEGKEFGSLDEIMRLIDKEAHGTWLLGGNGLWHGGIHISDVSNPLSALKLDTAATGEPVPLQFMVDGTITAYRINNDYLKAPYKGQELRYSSTFVLVKSQCQPDPQKKESWLEFYSLYMHLAPVKDYPATPSYKVRAGHSGIRLRKYTTGQYGLPDGQESGDTVTYQAPPKTDGNKKLRAGDRFVSSRTGRFYVTSNGLPVLTTFGLVRLLEGETAGNQQYWVTLDPTLMEQDGEIQALMPAWMQKAKAKGVFDSVQQGGETEEWKVSAGTSVGFMGCEDYPGEGSGQVEREWFVHLEVLSTDPNMPKFLSNPAGVKGEKRTVLAPKGKTLYTRQAAPGQEVFTVTAAMLGAQCVLPRDATTPVTDGSQQWWFNITGSGWLPQKDVEEAGQYDLLKLGFQPLEENSSGDMTYSPYELWVPEAFGSISSAAEQGDDWQYGQVPPFYRELMAEMDQDGDGKVTEEEIRQALTVRDPLVRNVVNHLIVKHHSEWYGGRSTGRWEGFYKDLDIEEVAYCEKWQLDLEWMSEVSPFNSDDAVWHFHPVIFTNTLTTGTGCAKLIWGKKVDEIHGTEKGCIFRKKVVSICSELWGDSKIFEYADVLMACMAVETSRKFMATVTELRDARDSNGNIIYTTGTTGRRPRREDHVYTADEIRADPSITQRKPVGLIQFTQRAVDQINSINNLSITKQQLALMDVIEQLDYVKLYFLSLNDVYKKILTPDDLYVFIFCPRGVGLPDDAVLYSRDINIDDYNKNSSLDSTTNGNTGNNDGVIQKRELLSRLKLLKEEGEKYRNNCICQGRSDTQVNTGPTWMPFAINEYKAFKDFIETESQLDDRIKEYHKTANANGCNNTTSWCSSFVNWCMTQSGYSDLATHNAAAFSWLPESWLNGEKVDKPFYGAIAVMKYKHVGFVYGKNSNGSILILGGNQSGARGHANCISISPNRPSAIKCIMKPKGYVIPPEHFELNDFDINGPTPTYEDTH